MLPPWRNPSCAGSGGGPCEQEVGALEVQASPSSLEVQTSASSASLPPELPAARGSPNGWIAPRSLWKYLVDPRRIFHRYLLLVLICCFIPGPYFADSLLATYKAPISQSMHLSNKEFGLLFALSSLTGVCCGPGGLLIVRLGRTRIALGAGLVCALGALGTVLGFRWRSLPAMLVARLFFWIALYALQLVQTLLVYTIFEGPAMNLAYSLLILACRLGGSVGYFLSGPLMHGLGVQGSLWLSVVLVFGAFGATLLFAYFFRGTATAQAVRPLLNGGRAQAKAFSPALLREVPGSAGALICAISALYGTVFPFEVVADDMLQTEFGFSADDAGFLLTTVPMVSVVSPLFSPWLGTTVHQQLLSCGAGMGTIVVAQVVLAVQATWSPWLGCGLMGAGYAVSVCSLWITLPNLVRSAVPAEVAKDVEGLVTGLTYMALAACQFTSNLAVGSIKDMCSYRWVCTWFACLAAAGFLSIPACAVCYRSALARAGNSNPELAGQSPRPSRAAASPAEGSDCAATTAGDAPRVANLALSGSVVEEDYCSASSGSILNTGLGQGSV